MIIAHDLSFMSMMPREKFAKGMTAVSQRPSGFEYLGPCNEVLIVTLNNQTKVVMIVPTSFVGLTSLSTLLLFALFSPVAGSSRAGVLRLRPTGTEPRQWCTSNGAGVYHMFPVSCNRPCEAPPPSPLNRVAVPHSERLWVGILY